MRESGQGMSSPERAGAVSIIGNAPLCIFRRGTTSRATGPPKAQGEEMRSSELELELRGPHDAAHSTHASMCACVSVPLCTVVGYAAPTGRARSGWVGHSPRRHPKNNYAPGCRRACGGGVRASQPRGRCRRRAATAIGRTR